MSVFYFIRDCILITLDADGTTTNLPRKLLLLFPHSCVIQRQLLTLCGTCILLI